MSILTIALIKWPIDSINAENAYTNNASAAIPAAANPPVAADNIPANVARIPINNPAAKNVSYINLVICSIENPDSLTALIKSLNA